MNSVTSPIGWNNYPRKKNLYIGYKKCDTIIITEWESKKKIMYDFTCENIDCWYKPRVQSCYFDRKQWKLWVNFYDGYEWESSMN